MATLRYAACALVVAAVVALLVALLQSGPGQRPSVRAAEHQATGPATTTAPLGLNPEMPSASGAERAAEPPAGEPQKPQFKARPGPEAFLAPAAVSPLSADWKDRDELTAVAALQSRRPLVLCFVDVNDPGDEGMNQRFAALSKESALFVRVTFDPGAAAQALAGTVVPAGKFLAEDAVGAYGITSAPTVLVCDWHGSEYFRYVGRVPPADELQRMLAKLPAVVDEMDGRLDKRFQAAKAAWEKQDRPGALRQILRSFRDEYVGLDAVTRTIALYDEIMVAARAEIAALKASGDRAGLEKVVKELKGTDAVKDAEEALDALGGE